MRWACRLVAILLVAAAVADPGRPADAAFEVRGGLRAAGMGQAFTGLGDDPSGMLYNPALVQRVPGVQISGAYRKPFFGVDNLTLSDQFFGVAYPFGGMGALGASFVQFGDEIYTEQDLALGYAIGFLRRRALAMGVTFHLLRKGYKIDALDEIDQRKILSDPLYASGNSKGMFSLDLGIHYRLTDGLSIGIAAFDVLEPDGAFYPGDSDPIRRSFRTGLAWKPSFATVTADVEYGTGPVGGRNPTRLFVGVERFFWSDRLALRSGARDNLTGEGRSTHLAAGFSVEFLRREWEEPGYDLLDGKEYTYIKRLRVVLDSAWEYATPMSEIVDPGIGSPALGLTVHYDVTKVYQKFMTRQELEEALKKRKEQVAFEVVEDLRKSQVNLLESERRKIEAMLQERFEAEREQLEKEIEQRARLIAEKSELENRQRAQGLSEEVEEKVRQLEEVIRDKEVVIQRSTRTNEALRHLVEAVRLYFEGDYDGSERECLTAIDIAPYLALSYVRLGSVYLKQGRIEDTIGAWERALEIEPENAELREWLEALRGGG